MNKENTSCKWIPGRQGTGYFKRVILQTKWFDMWILKYPREAHIPEHVDPVDGFKHYRVNIVLQKAELGGEFFSDNTIVNILDRVYFFRPDKSRHGVSRVHLGTRYVLSIGWAR